MINSLNQRAIIEAPVRVPDGAGGGTESWSTLAIVWAGLVPLTAADKFGPDALESRVKHKLTIRRLASIGAGMRAAIGSRLFAIRGVLDEGPRASLMTLLVEEQP